MQINKTHVRAIVVEDMDDDVALLVNALRRGGFEPHYTVVNTPEALYSALESQPWDIIFCDYSMPKMNGREALTIVRQQDPEVPFIFVSATIGEDFAVEAMRSGAQDYIMKDNLKRLAPAVHRELTEAAVRHDRLVAKQQLDFITNFDRLTHLPNRIRFLDVLRDTVTQAEQEDKTVAIICVNLDRFKNVNDSLGREAGDIVLQETARRLVSSVTKTSIVSRFAADEFFILLPPLQSQRDITEALEQLLQCLHKPYDVLACKIYLTASLGVTCFPQHGNDADMLVRNADIANCKAKDQGGKGYCLYQPEMTIRLEELMVLEQAMRLAILRNEFVLYYQPQLELEHGNIIGLEALVRWDRPGLGMVPPDEFIPLAEETGLIIALGQWVLRQVCQQACQWRRNGMPPMRVAVNISSLQFHQKDLAEQIMAMLNEYGLEPSWLEVEITESVIMQDTETALETLQKLQQTGVKVSLDDFGTGYSSLSYLKYFKVNNLKIDRAFIKDIPDDKDDAAITCAVIAMAGKLNMKVVAEGVETRQQCEFLRAEGCDYVQGYYLGRPMTVDQLEQWFSTSHALSGYAKPD